MGDSLSPFLSPENLFSGLLNVRVAVELLVIKTTHSFRGFWDENFFLAKCPTGVSLVTSGAYLKQLQLPWWGLSFTSWKFW